MANVSEKTNLKSIRTFEDDASMTDKVELTHLDEKSKNSNDVATDEPLEHKNFIANDLQYKIDANLGNNFSNNPVVENSVDFSEDFPLEGNIITDKKRTGFNLFTATAEAMTEWFKDEKKTFDRKVEQRQKSIPTIRAIDDRKDIIEKAAKQSAIAPKDDYQQLTANIPKTNPEVTPIKTTPVTIKEKKDTKPSWSHYTDQSATPEAPMVTRSTNTEVTTPPVAIETSPILSTPPAPTPINTITEVVPTIPAPQITTPTPSTSPEPTINKPTVKLLGGQMSWLGKFVFYTLIAIISTAGIGGGIVTVWWFSNKVPITATNQNTNQFTDLDTPHTSNTVTTQRPTGIYDSNVNVTFSNSTSELWQNIIGATPNGLTKIMIDATSQDIFRVLNLGFSDTFIRNVSSVDFGKYENRPFIIMNITSFDTALGGMLATEDKLALSLNNLFPAPADITATTSYDFVDELIDNKDVRILKYHNLEQSNGFIYGFIKKNILIIVPDPETYRILNSKLP